MTEKEKLHSGEIYQPMGQEILEEQLACMDIMDEYNAIPRKELERRG